MSLQIEVGVQVLVEPSAGRRRARRRHGERGGEATPAGQLQDPFRRAGLLRAVRRPAGRDPAAGPGPARHHGAPAGAGHRANAWRTSSATSGRASSPAAPPTGRSCPARTCRWSSAWTGGYVHSSTQRTRRDGWFEVIAGKAMPAIGRSRCFGYVQTYDSNPKRRIFEVLASQGMRAQPAGHLPHRRRRGHPRPAAPPQSAGRAPAGLVPPSRCRSPC